jgi:tRNA 2-thiocytidine biosynthesis protein TtcA
MPWAIKRAQHIFSRTLSGHRLLEDGEPVVVGVSGGADSLCLLHLLHEHNLKHRKGWRIHPVHIDPGFPGWNSKRVARACERIGLPCLVPQPGIARESGADSCYACARERRKVLFRTADELGARKLALAHHMDDANETFLLNLLYASSGSTILPKQPLFRGRLFVVRPLYYMDKDLLLRYLKQVGLSPVRNKCPFERAGSRALVRRLLARLYQENPRARTNLFWGMQNLKPDYLPGLRKS